MDRLRRCPDEVADEFWPSSSRCKKTRKPCASRAGPAQQLSEDVGAPGTEEIGELAMTQKLSEDQMTESCDLASHEEGATAESAMCMGKTANHSDH